jgi:hypothetical protein
VRFASFSALAKTAKMQSRWCCAVSRGRNPWPGGVMYVSLTFESTIAGPFPDSSCCMIPIPSLLAEPSRPNAIGMLNCIYGAIEVRFWSKF